MRSTATQLIRRAVVVARYYADLYQAWMLFQRLLTLGCIGEEVERRLRSLFRGTMRSGVAVWRQSVDRSGAPR